MKIPTKIIIKPAFIKYVKCNSIPLLVRLTLDGYHKEYIIVVSW